MSVTGRAQTLTNPGAGLNFPVAAGRLTFIAMTDETRTADPRTMLNRLPRGGILIFRHYTHPQRRTLAIKVVRACHKRGIRCLIADDIRLAKRCNADGIHLPQYRLSSAFSRRLLPQKWLITVAAHNRKAVHKAERLGLDAVLLSPVFATPSHPEARPLGILRLAAICHQAALPVIALGGINLPVINRIRQSGVAGIAGISLFYDK